MMGDMLRKILFATDLSPYAGAVVDCVGGLRQAGVQQVVLLHVIDQALGYVEGAVGFDIIGQLKIDAQQGLAREQGRLEEQGYEVRTRLEVGIPAKEIVRVAEEEDVSLIVVGAYGRTLLEDALLGSVAERVLRLAKRPVLVERPRMLTAMGRVACERRGASVFERVLFPTDFSPRSAIAQHFVAALREAGLQEVTVLHVLEEPTWRGPGPRGERLARHAQIMLEQVTDALVQRGLQVRGRLERGKPVAKIVEVAEEENVGSIVMASRGRGIVAELLLGSVAEGVVRHSARPVVVVPAGTEGQ